MTPSVDNELSRARRSLAWRRWTAVITTTGTGVVLVALTARLATQAAAAVALLVAVAVGAAAWRATRLDRRWRRALGAIRSRDQRARQEH